jgi:hypothetical protein
VTATSGTIIVIRCACVMGLRRRARALAGARLKKTPDDGQTHQKPPQKLKMHATHNLQFFLITVLYRTNTNVDRPEVARHAQDLFDWYTSHPEEFDR